MENRRVRVHRRDIPTYWLDRGGIRRIDLADQHHVGQPQVGLARIVRQRMTRPSLVRVVGSGRVHPLPLVTHRFTLDDIAAAYNLFGNQRDGVLRVAITM
jgi:threonine dehydrogenase-like Zn-dependent dehydrogenase